MLYEGTIEIFDDLINIDLKPQVPDPTQSQYTLQMNNNTEDLTSVMGMLNPQFAPDESPSNTKSYISGLQKSGFGTFYADSLNIQDLQRIYKTTEPYIPSPFPGLASPVSQGEVVFTETIPKYTGYINKKPIYEKHIDFTYRRRLR